MPRVSPLVTDVIDKKSTWPASVGFSDHMAHSYENTDALDVDLFLCHDHSWNWPSCSQMLDFRVAEVVFHFD